MDMDKLDLAILFDSSSWSVTFFIDAGGSKREQKLQNDFEKRSVDFRAACVKYGGLSTTTLFTSSEFSYNALDITLHQNLMNEAENNDALTLAIQETGKLAWRNDTRKFFFILADTPPNILSKECNPVLDIFKSTRKLGGKGVV